jgi:hypothetical protein
VDADEFFAFVSTAQVAPPPRKHATTPPRHAQAYQSYLSHSCITYWRGWAARWRSSPWRVLIWGVQSCQHANARGTGACGVRPPLSEARPERRRVSKRRGHSVISRCHRLPLYGLSIQKRTEKEESPHGPRIGCCRAMRFRRAWPSSARPPGSS